MTRTLVAIALYALTFAALWYGVDMAPAKGWPVNDTELNGCALLVLAMAAKLAGHVTLMKLAL